MGSIKEFVGKMSAEIGVACHLSQHDLYPSETDTLLRTNLRYGSIRRVLREVGIMKLPVLITLEENGYFVAEIPVLPGCISQGRTKEEAIGNIKEAAELCLESMEEERWTVSKEYSLDQVEVSA
jgi:predicted RNase H-like HicB family nuclease